MKITPALAIASALFSLNASAIVIQTTGAGSAVLVTQGGADFESQSALFDNPYSEGGMLFSRTNLTFDNNGCGFAGCVGHQGFTGFSGNYMYGTGGGGFFTIQADAGNRFLGLEMAVGTGFSQSNVVVVWEAYDGATLVGSGNVNLSVNDIIGFADASGFSSIRLTSTDGTSVANFTSTFNAPAFDMVRAQSTRQSVPEPATLALMGLGLGLAGVFARRRT